MARIRIVDEWLRSPVSPPTRHRAIMVIADSWSEQRVLMRAFAASEDQTRPTIVLHGAELAISPAGTDPHGHWGIHVEPPVDGRAQELRGQLELAARRLSGSKGNPPRLEDEEPKFERKPTNNWAPGAPRDRRTLISPPRAEQRKGDRNAGYYEPARVAPPTASPVVPSAAPRPGSVPNPASGNARGSSSPGLPSADSSVDIVPAAERKTVFASDPAALARGAPPPPPPQPGFAAAYASASPAIGRTTPAPWSADPAAGAAPPAAAASPSRRRKGWTSPVPPAGAAVDRPGVDPTKTAPGFAPMATPVPRMPSATPKPGPSQSRKARNLAALVGHTMPLGFRLSDTERDVLNALGKSDALTASQVARIAKVASGIEWMEELMNKLADHGLDLIAPGEDASGEPTYVLRR